MISRVPVFVFLLALISFPVFSQEAIDSELYITLKKNDSLLFDEGFNHCRISTFEHLISEDLEFYHDQGGLTTNKEDFLSNVRIIFAPPLIKNLLESWSQVACRFFHCIKMVNYMVPFKKGSMISS